MNPSRMRNLEKILMTEGSKRRVSEVTKGDGNLQGVTKGFGGREI